MRALILCGALAPCCPPVPGADGGKPDAGKPDGSNGPLPFPLPYRARVRANGRVRPMGDVQTNGDCNVCHTEQGREGAPGRILWP